MGVSYSYITTKDPNLSKRKIYKSIRVLHPLKEVDKEDEFRREKGKNIFGLR